MTMVLLSDGVRAFCTLYHLNIYLKKMSPGKLKVVIIYIFLKLQQVAILSTNLYYLCLLHVLTEDNLH